ncbi:MAG: cytochrome b N-terminal domain-containing protein [Lentisphaerae bacterium]|nr:cytochrome b N-terminal domain-containing protein [Lentisphaerota bacterium]
MSDTPRKSGFGELLANLRALPRNLTASINRRSSGESARGRSQSVFGNVFLHIHSVRTHRWTLRPRFTMGLGVASGVLFLMLVVSGAVLMVHYVPSVSGAYNSVKNIHFVVPGGRVIRNLHRWAAYGMVVAVFLHMVRVFYTNSYKSPREFNWIIGVILFVLTLGLAFTGYCLPWDQLAYWAITIGANIAGSPAEVTDAIGITDMIDIGGFQKLLMLGSNTPGESALLRFYWGHCVVLPLAMVMFLAAHFWRIRKDGGLSRPDDIRDEELIGTPCDPLAEEVFKPETKTYGLMCLVKDRSGNVNRGPERTVLSWPHVLRAEVAIAMILLAIMLLLAIFIDAPLKEMANPSVPENPAKAPWYFLAMQEVISYSAFSGGMVLPGITVLMLMMIPYLDRREGGTGRWFGVPGDRRLAIGSAIAMAVAVVSMLTFTVKVGWLRDWFPDTNQILITTVNPGTVLAAFTTLLTLGALMVTGSTRKSAIVFFTCFLVSFVILTYFALVHRGPNWDFYWWPSLWPTH